MSKLMYFKRYLYVIDRLRSRSSSFEELQDYILKKLDNDDIATPFEYSVRTFERDKKDIEKLFGIRVVYDRKDKTYAIDDTQDTKPIHNPINGCFFDSSRLTSRE